MQGTMPEEGEDMPENNGLQPLAIAKFTGIIRLGAGGAPANGEWYVPLMRKNRDGSVETGAILLSSFTPINATEGVVGVAEGIVGVAEGVVGVIEGVVGVIENMAEDTDLLTISTRGISNRLDHLSNSLDG